MRCWLLSCGGFVQCKCCLTLQSSQLVFAAVLIWMTALRAHHLYLYLHLCCDADVSSMKIPIMASSMPLLSGALSKAERDVLLPLPGQLLTAQVSALICNTPYNFGRESQTRHAVLQLLMMLDTLGGRSNMGALPAIHSNPSERQYEDSRHLLVDSSAGFGSKLGTEGMGMGSAVGSGLRPDTVIVCANTTLMIGVEREADGLYQAMYDIQKYARGGLPVVRYGGVHGIPAYAAAGTELQFLFIKRDGQVRCGKPSV